MCWVPVLRRILRLCSNSVGQSAVGLEEPVFYICCFWSGDEREVRENYCNYQYKLQNPFSGFGARCWPFLNARPSGTTGEGAGLLFRMGLSWIWHDSVRAQRIRSLFSTSEKGEGPGARLCRCPMPLPLLRMGAPHVPRDIWSYWQSLYSVST